MLAYNTVKDKKFANTGRDIMQLTILSETQRNNTGKDITLANTGRDKTLDNTGRNMTLANNTVRDITAILAEI